MKKLITIFLTATMLLGSCLLFPVSAETTTSLDDKLVVHYDFDTYNVDEAGVVRFTDIAPAGTSKETLRLYTTQDTEGNILSYAKDGYLHLDKAAGNKASVGFSTNLTTETASGRDIFGNQGGLTIYMDVQVNTSVSGASNIVLINSMLRAYMVQHSEGYNPVVLRFGTDTTDYKTSGYGTNDWWNQCDRFDARVKYAIVLNHDAETQTLTTRTYLSYDDGKTYRQSKKDITIENIASFYENASGMSVGKGSEADADRNCDMDIYDFRIYNDVLDADDLVSIGAEQNEVFYVGYQNSAEAYKVNENDTTYVYDTRLIATIDSKDYVKAGFKVYDGDYTLSSEVTHCFTSIMAQDAYGEQYTVEAPNNRYYIALTISEIPMGTNPTFTVIPWVELSNGTVLHYDAVTVTVDEPQIPTA